VADPAQLERLLSGADLWNTWRLANPGTHPDLTGADLRGLRLSRWRPAWEGVINVYEPGFDLTWADLTDAAFTSAKCYTADFSYATLTRTDFADTELLHCDFRNADLTRARLDRSWLTNARFSKTILYETSFRGTRLWNTTFADVDLSEVVGLADAEHYGPSTLGMDTLMRSGELPPSFMLGCGIPTSINEYLPSLLLGETIPVSSVTQRQIAPSSSICTAICVMTVSHAGSRLIT